MIVLQAVIANLFVIKQINLFSKILTCTDVFIIGAVFAQNLLQEYFGRKEAIKAIKVTFFSLVFFLVMSKVHLFYSPSSSDTTNESFKNILSSSPRIFLASIFTFFLTQRIDVIFFSKLKKIFDGKKIALRLFLSAVFIQILDTLLFSFLGLYGIVDKIFDIMIFSFLIKLLVILTSSIFLSFSKKIIKTKPQELNETV